MTRLRAGEVLDLLQFAIGRGVVRELHVRLIDGA
jgi:hypothetical protein